MKYLMFVFLISNSFAEDFTSHKYQEALHGIDYNNICITDTQLKTIKPISVCTQYETRIEHQPHNENQEVTDCIRTEFKNLNFSREFERSVCLEMTSGRHYSGCKTFGFVKDFLPDSIIITTITQLTPERDNFPGVDSIFNFPECN